MQLCNIARERLSQSQVALGVGVRFSRSIEIVYLMRKAGFHWLFLDLEHGAMTLDTATQIAIAARDANMCALLRIPRGDFSMATRALDNGTMGIVAPSVATHEEAQEIVQALKYPPMGRRSISSNMPQFDYDGSGIANKIKQLNETTLIVAMIETRQGLSNVDAIAAVHGIDIVLIGTNDLCAEMGITGQFDHPDINLAYEQVIAACNKHGKWAGMGGVRSVELMRKHIANGVRFVLAGSDLTHLASGAADQVTKLS